MAKVSRFVHKNHPCDSLGLKSSIGSVQITFYVNVGIPTTLMRRGWRRSAAARVASSPGYAARYHHGFHGNVQQWQARDASVTRALPPTYTVRHDTGPRWTQWQGTGVASWLVNRLCAPSVAAPLLPAR